jgi:hypothetical protein
MVGRPEGRERRLEDNGAEMSRAKRKKVAGGRWTLERAVRLATMVARLAEVLARFLHQAPW